MESILPAGFIGDDLAPFHTTATPDAFNALCDKHDWWLLKLQALVAETALVQVNLLRISTEMKRVSQLSENAKPCLKS